MTKGWLTTTPPKTGKKFIIFATPTGSYFDPQTGRWGYGKIGKPEVGEAHYAAGLWQRNGGTWDNPTHWMPHPAKPKKASKS